MPQISAIRMPTCRSERAEPSFVSMRCTKSSTLPAWWQAWQLKIPLARFTEQLGSWSSWKGQRILAWSPCPIGVRP
jgi:hypothetical protein